METLKDFREKSNMTQKEMADRMGVSYSYYQKVEGGFKKPSFNFITKYKTTFPKAEVSIFFKQYNH